MPEFPRHPQLATPAELQERIRAERAGEPFLVYRDSEESQRISPLPEGDAELSVGRNQEADVAIGWDELVSGLHAMLRRTGGSWLVIDDGLSRNGTFVNGERVVGRTRLRDGDEVRVGTTVLVFRVPSAVQRASTAHASGLHALPHVSPAQQPVLIALCRPYATGEAFARPPTNQQIADELHLSIAAVKTHLRGLFQRFGLDELGPNEKRSELVHAALDSGAVSSADLRRPS